jgi:hypothetical protein
MTTVIIVIILGLFLYAIFNQSTAIKNWNTLIPNMQQDTTEFYDIVDDILSERKVPGIKTSRPTFNQGGMLSSSRIYLEVRRGDYKFHICAAPWGTGFFVSWWTRESDHILRNIPFIGKLFEVAVDPTTYYKLDTDAMFRSSVHQAVVSAIDKLTEVKGIRKLTELERTADLRMLPK